MEQSPINLVKWPSVSTDKMAVDGSGYMNYAAGALHVEKLKSTIEVPFTDGNLQLTFPDGSMADF